MWDFFIFIAIFQAEKFGDSFVLEGKISEDIKKDIHQAVSSHFISHLLLVMMMMMMVMMMMMTTMMAIQGFRVSLLTKKLLSFTMPTS